ncbi:MAG: HesA/MoeB/ThiF family protein [Gammaproteobacteria bacterium]|jgi:adenylyltransferase/sulfurtransferase
MIRNRYARQEVLPEIGREGQACLGQGSVLIVGAGGLGAPAALYLAAAGVGRIGLLDPDRVELTNLQRQILYDAADIGQPKVLAGRARLGRLNSGITIDPICAALRADNAMRLIGDYDVVLDGSDNFQTKYLVSDAARKAGKPVVFASIQGFEARLAVFTPDGPCYRCLYPEPPAGVVPNCAEAGVLGAVSGMAGAMQAMEAIKLLLGSRASRLRSLAGRLLVIDACDWTTRRLAFHQRPDCPSCSQPPESICLSDADSACVADVDGITVAGLAELAGAGLLDCRESDEWTAGHIPGAISLPLSALMRGEVPALRPDRPWVVYCSHGARSLAACRLLREQGLQRLWNLEGGLQAWEGPLEKAPPEQ